MRFLLVSLAFITMPLQVRADDPQLAGFQGLDANLRKLTDKHYAGAKFEFVAGEYQVSADTMTFTLHRTYRDGQISMDTDQVIGPQYRGFVITADDIGKNSYGGPLMIPQTLRKPYWHTYVNQIQDPVSGSNLWVRYEYGSRVNADFHRGDGLNGIFATNVSEVDDLSRDLR